MKLYHGSSFNIKCKYLKPHKPFDTDDYTIRVCFGTEYTTALAYSINPVRSYAENIGCCVKNIPAFSCHCDLKKDKPEIYELYEGMFDELFNKPCYVYECEVDDAIIKTANNGFEKYVEERVKIGNEIVIENCLSELKKQEQAGNIILVRYNDNTVNILSESIEHKAISIKTDIERDFIENKCGNFGINVEDCKRKFLS